MCPAVGAPSQSHPQMQCQPANDALEARQREREKGRNRGTNREKERGGERKGGDGRGGEWREGKRQTRFDRATEGGWRQSRGEKANGEDENKTAPSQKHRGQEEEKRPSGGLPLGSFPHSKALPALPRNPHQWEVEGSFPSQAGAFQGSLS